MRRHFIITVICLLVATGVAVLAGRCVRTLPSGRCSELYQRYADAEGVKASFVKGYRVDDSVRVDVTLLEATDSAAWERLKTDFKVKITLPKEYLESDSPKKIVFFEFIPKNSLSYVQKNGATDSMDKDLIAAPVHDRKVCVFHVENQEQVTAIIRKYTREVNPNNIHYESNI